jgi:hypothetical protein
VTQKPREMNCARGLSSRQVNRHLLGVELGAGVLAETVDETIDLKSRRLDSCGIKTYMVQDAD